jgi:GTPase
MAFLDELTIKVQSGSGGRGCISYMKRMDRKRVPNGGDGGKGGNVILRADPQTGSLVSLKAKRMFEAEAGEVGGSNKKHGRNGNDYIVKVPCGTTIFNKTDQLLIRDLVAQNDQIIVVKGGRGGFGNHSDRPEPVGGQGQFLELFLSFKITADIFLIGLPNSGKTLFLKELTGAGVEETDYPFATKAPQLGTYNADVNDYRICELPSIYEASCAGRGLSTHFLKHLERAKLIFLFVDTSSKFVKDSREGYHVLLKVLKECDARFLNVPRIAVVNKIDLIKKEDLKKLTFPKGEKVHFISNRTQAGVKRLMASACGLLDQQYAQTS